MQNVYVCCHICVRESSRLCESQMRNSDARFIFHLVRNSSLGFFLLHVPGEAVPMLLRSPCVWFSFVYRNTEITEMHYNILLFGGLWENELRSSCLQGKHFIHWAICPSLRRSISNEPVVDMVARGSLVIYCNL